MNVREKLNLMEEAHERNEERIKAFMLEHGLQKSYMVEKHMEGELPSRNDVIMIMGENVARIMARSLYTVNKAKGYHVTITECRENYYRQVWIDGEEIE